MGVQDFILSVLLLMLSLEQFECTRLKSRIYREELNKYPVKEVLENDECISELERIKQGLESLIVDRKSFLTKDKHMI